MPNSTRPRVAITAPSLDQNDNVSGISSVVRNVLEELGDRCEFIHLKVAKKDKNTALVGMVEALRDVTSALFGLGAGRCDLLHLNLALSFKAIVRDYVILLWAGVLRIPVVTHVHGGKHLVEPAQGLLKPIIESYLSRSHSVIVLSRYEKRELLKNYVVEEEKVDYIYNSVRIDPVQLDTRGETDRLRVLFAGRLTESKGIGLLLRLVEAEPEGIDFSIAGQGPLETMVRDVCADSRSADYLGPLSSAQMLAQMQCHDVLLLPSLWGEGMPMGVVEAMALGMVPVTTRNASLVEIIIEDETGATVQPDDLDGTKQVLDRLRLDRELRKKLSNGARQFADANLNRGKNMEKLLQIYMGAVSRR